MQIAVSLDIAAVYANVVISRITKKHARNIMNYYSSNLKAPISGDCPICYLPLPLDPDESNIRTCCSKMICNGCAYADALRQAERMLQHTCPFCRTAVTHEDKDKRLRKRIEANDPVAMGRNGVEQYKKGDYSSAIEHFMKGAELGDADAQFNLGCCYHLGHGVEKDDWKFTRFMEEAAIGGHP